MRTSFEFRVSNLPSLMGKALAIATSAALCIAFPATASAQGCAMCNANASAANQAGIQALQNGILILLVPPLLMFAGIIWLAFRSRSGRELEGAHLEYDSSVRMLRIAPEFRRELAGETVFPKTLDSNRIEETGFQAHIRE